MNSVSRRKMYKSAKVGVASASFVAAVLLGACAGMPKLGGSALSTGSVTTNAAQLPASASPRAAAKHADATPASTAGALAVAREMRLKGDRKKALVELERARRDKPDDKLLAREEGLVALELGQLDKAKKSLEAAADPDKPDWHTLSALGTLHATSGNQKLAQQYFLRALEQKPDHQATLNNLALSYALQGNLAKAEKTLRTAAAKNSGGAAHINENLALVVGLSGKFDDAQKIAGAVMPKEQAERNIAYLRQIAQPGG